MIRLAGGLRGILGVARHFLHRGGHFVHGRCDLIGLDLLAVHAGAGLLGDGRQLLGGAGHLCDAVADTADELAQGRRHAHHALLQRTDFVLALDAALVGQVAGGDVPDDCQGIRQGAGDLPGDQPGGQQADEQGQHGHRELGDPGLGGVVLESGGLGLGEGLAETVDLVGLALHFLARGGDRLGLGDHGLERHEIAVERLLGDGHLSGNAVPEYRLQARGRLPRQADLLLDLGRDLGGGGDVVAAHLVAHQLPVHAQVGNRREARVAVVRIDR